MYDIFRVERRHRPILLYSCEVKKFVNLDDIEKLQPKLCKRILHLKNNTLNFMLYDELGRFSIKHIIYTRTINFWKGVDSW